MSLWANFVYSFLFSVDESEFAVIEVSFNVAHVL